MSPLPAFIRVEDIQLTTGEIFPSTGSWDATAPHHWTAAEIALLIKSIMYWTEGRVLPREGLLNKKR